VEAGRPRGEGDGPAGPRPGRLARLGQFLEPEDNPAGVIYGTITAGALLAAESSLPETLVRDAGGVALALGLVWLAHAYAQSVGQRLRAPDLSATRAFGRALVHEGSILKGSFVPLVVLLVAWALGASVSVAVTSALVASAVLLVVLEGIAGFRTGGRSSDLLARLAVGAVLGLGVFSLKIVLH